MKMVAMGMWPPYARRLVVAHDEDRAVCTADEPRFRLGPSASRVEVVVRPEQVDAYPDGAIERLAKTRAARSRQRGVHCGMPSCD